jgi:hypothetical protein
MPWPNSQDGTGPGREQNEQQQSNGNDHVDLGQHLHAAIKAAQTEISAMQVMPQSEAPER